MQDKRKFHSLPLLMNSYPDFDHKVNFFPNQTVCIDTKQSEKHSSHENYLSSKEWLMVWAKNKIWSIGQKTQPSISRVFLAVVGLFCFISHYYLFFNVKTMKRKKILNWKIINSYFVSVELPKEFWLCNRMNNNNINRPFLFS